MSLSALHADGSSVRLHDVLDDRQAEAGATTAATGAISLVEAFEDARQVLGSDTDTGIAYLDLMAPSVRATATLIDPPSGVNLIALWTRFRATRSRRSASPMNERQAGSHI